MKSTEKNTQYAVLQYLAIRGHFCWRNNTGTFRVQDRFIHTGKKGSADIIGCSSDGRLVAIECKDIKGRLTELQEYFLEEIKKRGGYAIVARSLDDVINAGL